MLYKNAKCIQIIQILICRKIINQSNEQVCRVENWILQISVSMHHGQWECMRYVPIFDRIHTPYILRALTRRYCSRSRLVVHEDLFLGHGWVGFWSLLGWIDFRHSSFSPFTYTVCLFLRFVYFIRPSLRGRIMVKRCPSVCPGLVGRSVSSKILQLGTFDQHKRKMPTVFQGRSSKGQGCFVT